MKRSALFFVLFALVPHMMNAQGSLPGYLSQLTFPMVEVPINGDPYLDEEYRLGQVSYEGEVYRFYFRFNALRDRIELKDASTRLFHLAKNTIIEPRFGGKLYQYKSYFEGDSLKRGYFVPLNKGTTVLYYKPKKKFIQAQSPDNGYDSYKPPHYKDVSSYYIQFGNGSPQPIELKRRSFLEAFDSRRYEIDEYASRNELNYKEERDAIIIVNYFNRLLSETSR